MFRFAEKLTGFIMLRVFLQTYGCQMNARDSEFVTGVLIENGFGKVAVPEKADVVLFNS